MKWYGDHHTFEQELQQIFTAVFDIWKWERMVLNLT